MRLIPAAVLALGLLLPGGIAAAQDADTGGVSRADADAACAAVVGQDPPAPENEQAFRDAYNTTDNTDDGPASDGVSPEWQRLIYLQELHIDYGGPLFSCEGGAAVGLVAEPEPEPQPEPQPGDECTDPVSGQPGTINDNGNCVQDRDVFTTCMEAWAALDAGTLLPEQFPIRLAIEGETVICELPVVPPTTTEPPAPPTTEPPAPEPSEQPAPDLNCPDFPLPDGTTAQQALDADPADPHGLDEDTDGQACETDLGVIPADPPTSTPVEELAYTGASIGWLLGGGTALLALGVGALWFARRRGAEIH